MMQEKPFPRWLALAFGLAMLVALAGGAWFYYAQEQNLQRRVETELQTIGQFKVDQIVTWRAERLADANVLMDSAFLADAITHWLAAPQAKDTELILLGFRSLQEHYHYADVKLVDASGQIHLSLDGASGPIHAEAAATLAQVLRDRQPALSDLHLSPGDPSPHLDVAVPIFVQNGQASEPVGVLLLKADARQFLYPLIESWPTSSRTAETLLVRRDGDAALFLNDLRYQKGAALLRRIPLSQVDVPAVMVVLGQRGIVQGKDYRGVAVLAAISAVADSPWFMVSKMDRDEAFADWRRQSVFILALILLFVAATVAGAGMVWQRNKKAHYQSLAQAQASLRESEERFRLAINATREGLWEWNVQTNQEFFAPRWCEIIGYAFDDPELPHTFKSWASRIHPDDNERVMSALSNHLEKGATYDVDYRHRHKSGEYRWQNSKGQATFDETGKPIKMVGCISDITERKQAEETLRYHASLVASVTDAIISTDIHYNVQSWNQGAETLYGWRADELLGKALNDAVRTEYPGESHELVIKEFDATGRWRGEVVQHRKDGTPLHILASIALIADAAGKPVGMVAVNRDISERRRAETALQASELKYRQLFENASVGMYRSRLDGSAMLEANRHLCEIFGYSRAEILASPATLRWANPARRAEMVRLVREQGVLADYEIDIVTKGGVVKTCLASIRLYPEEGYLEGTAIDITDRRRAEAALRSALAETQRHQAETAALLQGAHAILEYGEFADAARAIFDVCKDLLGAAGGYVALLSEDGTENHVVFLEPGGRNCMVDPTLPMPIRGLRGEVYRTGTTIYHNDFAATAWTGLLPGGHVGLANVLFAPLVLDGVATGLLGLANKPGGFTENDARLATAFGALAAIALRNSQTLESLRSNEAETARRNAALAAQNAIAATISQSLDLDTLLNTTLDKVLQVMNLHIGSVTLLEDETSLRLHVHRGLSEQLVQAGQRVKVGTGISGRAVAEKVPVVLDLADYPLAHLAPLVAQEGIQSMASVPLLSKQGAQGALNLASKQPRAFQKEELALLVAIGQQIGMAVENARLFEQTQDEMRRAEGLRRIGEAINSTLDLDTLLQTVADQTRVLIGADYCEMHFGEIHVALVADLQLRIADEEQAQSATRQPNLEFTRVIYSGFDPTSCTVKGIPSLKGLDGEVFRTQKPLRLDDRTRHPLSMPLPDGHLEIGPILGVPIIVGGQCVADLMLTRLPGGRPFTAADEHVAMTIANQAAVAVQNAQLYEQVKAQRQEAIQQKQYAETVLHSIADGVYTVGRQRVILSWSEGAEATTGYTTAEALGHTCAELLRHTDEAGHVLCDTDRCPFSRVWATGRPIEPELVFTHCKDDRTVPVSVTAAPILDETGQSIGAVEVFRDVSKERELVASLQAASRAKTRFLANMSHELRTPLNGVLGISQALLQEVYGELNPKQTARLGNVYESGQHLLQLINDLLDVARVEENRLVLEMQPISVADLCQAAVRMLQPVADAKQIRLELKLGAGPALIEGDERRLRQVLLNLLGNAVKFTPEQGRVGLTAAGKAGGMEFVVWDTGIGIAAEHQSLLFQPFSQVDDDLARRHQGSGLGLALVKQLTELHGGWVAVESAPGRGSRFHVWLPAHRPPPTPDASRATLAASRSTLDAPRATLDAPRVLIVDDNPQVAQLVQDILETEGYTVMLAGGGAEGLAAAQDQTPDLILMDMHMPGMNGLEATRRLKADPATRAIPVVALTASAMPSDREQALAAGLDDYLTKPIELAVLTEAVEKWTRRSS